jgi:hypothetical protein
MEDSSRLGQRAFKYIQVLHLQQICGTIYYNKFYERDIMEIESTKVTVSLGYTLNLGNFQSLRVDIGVTDSKRDGENTDQAFDRIYAFVEGKLGDKVAEASQELETK